MTDTEHWSPRRSLRPPVPAIFQAADALSAAVDAHLAGQREDAAGLIRRADCPHVREWLNPLMGTNRQFPERVGLVRFRPITGAPPLLPKSERSAPRMPDRAGEERVIERYGHHCVFCGIPVIHARVRKRLSALYPAEAYWGARCHSGLWCLWLQIDHVLPHARGGASTDGNLVVTCSGCNYGRMNHTLEEVGLLDPTNTPRSPSDWDGLERLIR